jgi:hypothetical protein
MRYILFVFGGVFIGMALGGAVARWERVDRWLRVKRSRGNKRCQ